MSKRKAFNFYYSYYQVAKELSDKDRAAFIWAICQRQFEGVEPELTGNSKLAYVSQKHSIDSQVLGYETKTGEKLTPTAGGSQGGSQAPTEGPSVQVEEKGKEECRIDYDRLLSFINSTLNKKFAKINDAVRKKYDARLKDGYTKEHIMLAIENAAKDEYHRETNYKYLTPEFFSRSDKIDKFAFVTAKLTDQRPDGVSELEWQGTLATREMVRKAQEHAAKQ